jgi:two-component system response regulator DesR
MVLGALAALLDIEPDLKVVATVGSGDRIVPAALATRPDIAIIDIDLPVIDGLSAAEMLHAKLPTCRTLILTGLGRPGTLRRALSVSVSGFLLKDTPSERLAQAVREVAAGRRVIDPQLALTAWDVGENPLSGREIQALRLAAGGAEAPEIAATMHVSVGTVRNYLTKVVTKLNARNRVDAIRIATEAGWI